MRLPSHPPVGLVIGGRYRVLASLGEGTMGVVYRAVRIEDGLPVAVKVIDAAETDLVRRLSREAKALEVIAHPHALALLDFGIEPGGAYLVTALAPGIPLETMLRAQRLTPAFALRIADQVLDALSYAHTLGIVHRDIKPGNIIVAQLPDGSPHARLIDFGLAKFQSVADGGPGSSAESSITSRGGGVVGTPAYVSPEQVFGPTVDARSDIYSFGVVLFEMLTGSWPFVAEDVVDVLRAHALEAPPSLAETRRDVAFRPELEAVVARALVKKPRERFADATAMRAALAAVPAPAASLR